MTAYIKNKDGKFEDRTIEVLHAAVVAHYTKIGLYDHATPLKQKCYALTKAGETTKAVLINDLPEIKDGIGDILVCVINWAHLEGVDFMGAYKTADIIKFPLDSDKLSLDIHATISGLGNLGIDISWLLQLLEKLANNYDLTLADCLGCAYDVVVKRKIKFLNGVAIKDADWHKFPELAES